MAKIDKLDQGLAICVKDTEKRVLFQTRACKRVCSDLVGQVCNKGCMKDYLSSKASDSESSVQYLGRLKVDGRVCDSTVIDDGENITTIFRPLETIDKFMSSFNSFPLSKREREVALKMADGKTNSEIAKELYVSLMTVKTHINNIYKKLPDEAKEWLRARANGGA
jgi:DNA-binding CsgD family transcriptional regulator